MIFDALGSIVLGSVNDYKAFEPILENHASISPVFVHAVRSLQKQDYHYYSDDCDCVYCYMSRRSRGIETNG